MNPTTSASTTKIVLWILGIILVGAAAITFFVSRGDSEATDENATSTAGVICTMDAKMCPDGTYVGRTGPNCEFVCPTAGTSTGTAGSNAGTGANVYYPADIAK